MKKFSFSTLTEMNEFHTVQLNSFIEYIKIHSHFYKARKLRSIKSLDEFERLPLLLSAELKQTPVEEMRAAPWRNIRTVTRSSGTTGKSKHVLWTQDAIDWDDYWGQQFFRNLGIGTGDRLLLMMPLELTRIGGWPKILHSLGVFVIPVGRIRDDLDAKNAVTKAIEFKPTVLCASPNRVQSFTQDILKLGLDPLKDFSVTKICTGGTRLSVTMRKYLHKVWGAEIYDFSGANEISFLGFECREHDGMHILAGPNYVEVVDTEGKRITDGSTGEIVVTNYKNFGTPLLRYSLGDSGRMNYDLCACGRIEPRLYIEGRTVGAVTLGGTKLHASDIEEVILGFSYLNNAYQVITKQSGERVIVHFTIEANVDKNTVTTRMKNKIVQELSQTSSSIHDKVRTGAILFKVSIVDRATLPRSQSDKVKNQFQDLREG
jgi:phenylacetate-CoA ligase